MNHYDILRLFWIKQLLLKLFFFSGTVYEVDLISYRFSMADMYDRLIYFLLFKYFDLFYLAVILLVGFSIIGNGLILLLSIDEYYET